MNEPSKKQGRHCHVKMIDPRDTMIFIGVEVSVTAIPFHPRGSVRTRQSRLGLPLVKVTLASYRASAINISLSPRWRARVMKRLAVNRDARPSEWVSRRAGK